MSSRTEDREFTDVPSEGQLAAGTAALSQRRARAAEEDQPADEQTDDAATPQSATDEPTIDSGDATQDSADDDAHGHATDDGNSAAGGGDDGDDTADAPSVDPSRSSAWIAWTVAAALAVVAVVAVVQWRGLQGPIATVDAAQAAAVAYTEVLTEWDAGQGLEQTYAGLVSGATDEFVPEIDEVFSEDAREQLVAVDAVSDGTITEVLASEPSAEGVDVVVIVEQFVVTGPSADPAARTERVAQFRMVEQDGQWLVADLEMLSELQIAQETP